MKWWPASQSSASSAYLGPEGAGYARASLGHRKRQMGWVLAVDFGTTYTAAAIRVGERPEPLEIGGRMRVPSVVLVDDDGTVSVGSSAESLSTSRPRSVLREPKRRVGEPAPVILAGRAHAIVDLVAALLGHVYAEALQRQGTPPDEVRLTHPATWGRPRMAELRRAAALAGMETVVLVPEPVAAAALYASEAEVDGDRYVAVYDLGGGTFDTAVLQRGAGGFDIVGRPGGDPRLGGELFDELLAGSVAAKLDEESQRRLVTDDDVGWRRAAASLRSEARAAKEVLSDRQDAEVLVSLPTGMRQIRVERAELEALVGVHVDETIDLLRRNIADAGVAEGDLAAIYLVGGASRMPLVRDRIEAAFPGVRVSRRGDPKLAVALGATLPGATTASDTTSPVAIVDAGTVVGTSIAAPVHAAGSTEDGGGPPKPETVFAPASVAAAARPIQTTDTDDRPPVRPGSNQRPLDAGPRLLAQNRRLVVAAAAVLVVLTLVGVALANRRGDGDDIALTADQTGTRPGPAPETTTTAPEVPATAPEMVPDPEPEPEPVVTPPVVAPVVTSPPVTRPPVTQPPVTAAPVTQPPVTAAPVTQPPPAPNRAPEMRDDSQCSIPGYSRYVAVLDNDFDPDGDTLTVVSVARSYYGGATEITAPPPSLSDRRQVVRYYTPAGYAAGTVDNFAYTVSDGRGGIGTGTAYITITTAAQCQ